jgi:hypothetical protein
MCWFSISSLWLRLKISPDECGAREKEAASILARLEDTFPPFAMQVTNDLDLAREALTFSDPGLDELITVRSAKLAEHTGTRDIGSLQIEWLGFDSLQLGLWSLLLQGLYIWPSEFSADWPKRLNRHGLFATSQDALEFAKAYVAAAKPAGGVEPLPSEEGGPDAIEVGRVIF